MPNQQRKRLMIVAKRAAAQKRDAEARKAQLEKEGARLKAQAAENDVSGRPSIVTQLSELSVRERKLQSQTDRLPSVSGERKGRILSKHDVVPRRK
jgi:hypothetical protein